MRVFSIAWKDFRHTYRNIAGLAMMILAPLLLATALGAAFGAGGNFSVPPIKTALVNQDTGGGASAPGVNAGSSIVQALTSSGLSDLLTITQMDSAQAARDAVDKGDADVAVIIPADLTAAVTSQQGGNSQVLVYKDPSLTIGPAIVSAITQSVVQSIDGARAAAATSAQLAASLGVTDQAELVDVASKAAQAYTKAAQSEPPVSVQTRAPVIAGGQARQEPNVASQVLVGMMIFFMFFGAATPARSILEEHRTGTLSRLFTTPTPRSVILGGKYIAVYLIVLMQSIVLLLAGRLLFNAHWGAIGPVIALTLCGALVAASLGLLTVSFAKTPGQAGAISSAIFVFLALIGGNFVGTANVGGTFALVRRITPNGWLLEGWEHVLYGGSWSTVYVPLLAALAFALAFFALATFFFRRRYA
jgi:ABC-2 type transport system permease protein